MILVFFGTLAQARMDTHEVQERFFQSMVVWWSSDPQGFRVPVFPGGHLLGALLLVNLLSAHLRRFILSWRNAGVHLIHGGLIIMLAGGLFTDLFSVESRMQMSQGETKNYSEDTRITEWAKPEEGGRDVDRVAVNSEVHLRPVRYFKPYSITLQKFTHESYPGTEIPKNFTSKITVIDPAHGVNREVLISMNHPFRYGGETYYQSGFGRDNQVSILKVVRNPSFVAPYIACVVISLGLLIQFSCHLIGFTRRKRVAFPV